MTEGRVVAFNHEVVPDYLRTKSGPEVEDKLQHLTGRASQMAVDNVQLQVSLFMLPCSTATGETYNVRC